MTKGVVKAIIENLVQVEVSGPVSQNEICYIDLGGERLMAEVIKVLGSIAYTQVFESTRGLRPGNTVEFTEKMLEVKLGPGMLAKNYDGLQNDLNKMKGVFLTRGEYTDPLDEDSSWEFTPSAKANDKVSAGDWLGNVPESWISHKIMVPFGLTDEYTVKSIVEKGTYKITDTIAVITDKEGKDIELNMIQYWPVKIPIKAYTEKPRPFRLLETGVRTLDTLNPMVEGGTGFIPGPFGAGKTVLQHSISKNADADMIIMAACGERANEVVEMFVEFPKLDDPRTGRKLMERTIIICNTSNMPVAAREASVYTAMTIAEYYRNMGLKVLLLADSTSRWAQALREMSNRMEELPGPDAFPMDLPAIISSFYARAGFVYLKSGETGSITFIGTVSPAGGNLKEPVTESTKKAARCFYALSQARADSKRYPAVDPIDSYSKYLEYPEVIDYLNENVNPNWVNDVILTKDILRRGREAQEQINILGDDGVPLLYHDKYWKSELVDRVILQQDGFDDVDQSTPMQRQEYMLELILDICGKTFVFETFEEIMPYFMRLINICKQMNYVEIDTEEFKQYEKGLLKEVEERSAK
ncbi:MAG: V-type ATP synthase subunit A [Candidatus Cloacimonadaceae bacterium]|nr:V-type ATP synthase subunit A [Candidatus Cloacimonadota bacterium]MCK9178830.1 V-type ATP synthase subunit A [Candidatus Cloacimonadota bacterium]